MYYDLTKALHERLYRPARQVPADAWCDLATMESRLCEAYGAEIARRMEEAGGSFLVYDIAKLDLLIHQLDAANPVGNAKGTAPLSSLLTATALGADPCFKRYLVSM